MLTASNDSWELLSFHLAVKVALVIASEAWCEWVDTSLNKKSILSIQDQSLGCDVYNKVQSWKIVNKLNKSPGISSSFAVGLGFLFVCLLVFKEKLFFFVIDLNTNEHSLVGVY